jgi:trafficking protein particle complex subunit 13
MSPGSPRPSSPGPGARPQSPVYRARQPPGRPQSPAPSSATSTTQGTFVSNIPTLIAHSAPDIELALLVTCPPRVRLEHPFSINFSLALSVPSSSRPRTVRLAVQHVEMPRVAATMGAGSGTQPQPGEPFTPRLPSGLSTPTTVLPAHPALPTRPFDQLLADKLLVASPRTTRPGDVTLPPPIPTGSLEGRSTSEVLYLGSSVIILEPVRFKALTSEEAVSRPRVTTEVKAELTYVPMRRGLGRVGGLRVLLVDDRFDGDDESERVEPTILKEWDVIGEVWVEN